MRVGKLFFIVAFALFGFSAFCQSTKTLNIYFYEQPVMFYKTDKNNDYVGVEADILKEFVKWCDEKKKIKVTTKYYPYKSFNDFYSAFGSAPANSIGSGTVTINEERKQQFDFSAPYLKNIAVFVTHGSVPTFTATAAATSKAEGQASDRLSASLAASYGQLVGLVEKGSVHSQYMKDFVAKYSPNTTVQGVNGNLAEILASDPKYVAYMDIITYRELLKSTDKYFKMHRDLSRKGENFGFILPKNSEWLPLVNEFMEGGFGFTATKKYQSILEAYLGYEVINTVEMF